EIKDDYAAGMIGGNIKKDVEEAKKKIAEFKELSEILAKNRITKEVANQAYDQHKDRFLEVSEMFDKLIRADLDLLYETGMITPKHYEELTAKEGYASLKRDIHNELLGTPTTEIPVTKTKAGRNKVSSMIARHGSSLTIINPVYSAMLNHAEITKKALRQIVYNKVYDLSDSFPDIFQKIELIRSMDKNGKFTYPQDKDPNILMAWSNGKRRPLLVSKELKTSLDELLTYQNIHLFEKILIGANKLFTKGTTGLYLPFTISNFIVDQTTAAAQTNERLIPIFDPLKTLMVALEAQFAGFKSEDTKFLEEYLVLGGSRQTLVGWQDLSADDMYRLLNFEKHYLNKTIDTINNVEDIIAFLPKWSEILTRASEYIKARKAGKEIIVAMEEAGRVTAPFHHRGRLGGGTVGRTAIQSLPFFNASLQVLAQYGRTLKNPKTRNRALTVVLAMMAASIGALIYLINKGTKKQKDTYKSLQPTELTGYVFFPAVNGKDLIRLRVPDQMNVITALINMGISNAWLDAKYTIPEFIDATTAWIPDQLNISDPARMLTALIPQLAAPIIGVTLNTKFYPHVRPLENISMRNLPPSERYTEYTSAAAKYLGEKLNLSPVKLDFLVQGYLGRYVRYFTGQKISNPFLREMYMSGSRQIQKYYDLKEQNSFDWNASVKHLKEFTPQEKVNILETRGKIKLIDTLMDIYRKVEKLDKKNPRLLDLRSKILEQIDKL
ncbi:MAG: LPD38 domain-containing protein, partial [Candidatus Omnitrophota bacterium]